MNERNVATLIAIILVLSSIYFLRQTEQVGETLTQTQEPQKPLFYESPEKKLLRERMVEELGKKNITDAAVLDAFGRIPRHLFLSENISRMAYEDLSLPLGFNRTAPQPYLIALIIETVKPRKNERVLEVGANIGYGTAVLAELAGEVYAVEKNSVFVETASKALSQLGYENAHITVSDGLRGWVEHAPYDVIVVNNAVDSIPHHLSFQLASFGRIILPLKSGEYTQVLTLIEKVNNTFESRQITKVRLEPL